MLRPALSISGPTSMPGSVPGPTDEGGHAGGEALANSSATEVWTKKRLAAVQASPMLRILATIAPSTATSRSASSKTMKGALPPSSIEVRMTASAHWASRSRPTCGGAGEGELADPPAAQERFDDLPAARRW